MGLGLLGLAFLACLVPIFRARPWESNDTLWFYGSAVLVGTGIVLGTGALIFGAIACL